MGKSGLNLCLFRIDFLLQHHDSIDEFQDLAKLIPSLLIFH